MPTSVKDSEQTQENVNSNFNDVVNNSLSDQAGSESNNTDPKMSRRELRQSAKAEAKQNKKDKTNKDDQEAKGENDPLNQAHQTDKRVGHLSKLAKAFKQAKRGERMDAIKTLAKRALIKKARREVLKLAFKNPWVIGSIAVIFFLIMLIISLGANEELYADPNDPSLIPLLLSKTGPETAQAGDELTYQITVGYAGRAQDITIIDNIPEGTTYIDSSPSASFDPAAKTATWNLKDNTASPSAGLNNVNETLTIRLRALENDLYIINQAVGSVIGAGFGGPVNGDIAVLLPNPLPPDLPDVQDKKDVIISAVNQSSQNRDAYNQASTASGIPWQVFASIHFREGSANPNQSIVSGRPIGDREPDVEAGVGCSNDAPIGITDGIPEPIDGGCGFSSLADSGIYAGVLLKGKVGGDIANFEILVKALSRYNGGGNANCGNSPYANCPKLFYGEDDSYVMSLFDDKHASMYVIYCSDGRKCRTTTPDERAGTATAIKWIAQSNN